MAALATDPAEKQRQRMEGEEDSGATSRRSNAQTKKRLLLSDRGDDPGTAREEKRTSTMVTMAMGDAMSLDQRQKNGGPPKEKKIDSDCYLHHHHQLQLPLEIVEIILACVSDLRSLLSLKLSCRAWDEACGSLAVLHVRREAEKRKIARRLHLYNTLELKIPRTRTTALKTGLIEMDQGLYCTEVKIYDGRGHLYVHSTLSMVTHQGPTVGHRDIHNHIFCGPDSTLRFHAARNEVYYTMDSTVFIYRWQGDFDAYETEDGIRFTVCRVVADGTSFPDDPRVQRMESEMAPLLCMIEPFKIY